jgi:hypothetical protein
MWIRWIRTRNTGLGHLFKHRSLLRIGWMLCQRKITNTAPATLSAIQAASQSTFFMQNYTPLVYSGNDKNKQKTLQSQHKLALTARNTLFAFKIIGAPKNVTNRPI